MPLPTLTPELCHAHGTDKANRNMRKHCRTRWNAEDATIACDETNRLMALIMPPEIVEAMRRDGLIP